LNLKCYCKNIHSFRQWKLFHKIICSFSYYTNTQWIIKTSQYINYLFKIQIKKKVAVAAAMDLKKIKIKQTVHGAVRTI